MKKTGFRNPGVILNLIMLAGLLAHSLYRDIRREGRYCGDLRNRVVGARLQEDGKLPYFYHWQVTGELRYADPNNRWSSGAATMTATPFFHDLMIPVCDFPQSLISRTWLGMEYFLLLAMTAMTWRFTQNFSQRLLLLNTSALFTATEAWKNLIAAGQLYFAMGFLLLAALMLVLSGKKFGQPAAGLLLAVLILCRPIALVALLPFIPALRRYLSLLAATAAGILLYVLFVLASPFEKSLWVEYRQALQVHTGYHQEYHPAEMPAHERFFLKTLEGIDLQKLMIPPQPFLAPVHSENGNVFVVYEILFHRSMPLRLLTTMSVATLLLMTGAFFWHHRGAVPTPLQIVAYGWTLYMVTEMFSPIHRHQYNTVQWFPLLLAGLLQYPDRPAKSPCLWLLAAGLLLNISNAAWIPFRHSMGELAWIVAGILLAFDKRTLLPQRFSKVFPPFGGMERLYPRAPKTSPA